MSKQQVESTPDGVTLEMIVTSLVEHFGWEDLGRRIKIRCFTTNSVGKIES
jgi:uncharacterized protein (DUF2132 family)